MADQKLPQLPLVQRPEEDDLMYLVRLINGISTSLKIKYTDLAFAETQIAFVDPINGDDATAKMGSTSLKYATLKAAIDAFSKISCYVHIADGAEVVETDNFLTDISTNVRGLYIYGAFNRIENRGTRPFDLTNTNIRQFHLTRAGGNGTIQCASAAYVVFCQAWTGTAAEDIYINVGDIQFIGGGTENHRVIATIDTAINVDLVCGTVSAGSLLNCRNGSGHINIQVNGNVTVGPSSGITESAVEYSSGNYVINIYVTGVIDITPFTNTRSGVTRSATGTNNGTSITLKSDIKTDKNHIFGLFNHQDGKLPKMLSYTGRVYGDGSGDLVFETNTVGDFSKVVNFDNVVMQVPGSLFYKSGTGEALLNVTNTTCLSTPIDLATTAGIISVFIDSLYVVGEGAALAVTNRVNTSAIQIYAYGVVVQSTGTASSELLIAESSTAIVGQGVFSSVTTNIASKYDLSKFQVIEYLTSVNGIDQVARDISVDLGDIPDGPVRKLFTEYDAEDAGKKQGTTFPLTPNDYQKFFRADIGMMFVYDQSRSKWLSEYTREIHWFSSGNTTGVGSQSLLSGGNDREYLVGDWTLVGLVMGNQANGFEGDVAITNAAASGASVYDQTGIVGGVNNFLVNTNVTANARINVDVNSTGDSDGIQRPMVTLIFKKLQS
jgi:hypothetical protein